MRIGLLTASASRLGGGVFEAVVAHAALLHKLGGKPHVFALADDYSEPDRERFGAVPVTVCPVVGPGMVGFAPALDSALRAAKLDILHLHGIWMYPSRAGANWALRTGRGYAISPHGMLAPWITDRGRWKKRLARLGYERRSWRAASVLHALTAQEEGDIRQEFRGIVARPNIQVIANPAPPARPLRHAPGSDIVFIGRIHPKKNLRALIGGFSKLHASDLPSDARLVIAGWGDAADIDALTDLIAATAAPVEFVGPVYGDRKQALLDSARFVALPSFSEGLPVAVLEAWSAGTPVLMSRTCNLEQGFENGAAIDCGTDVDRVAAALRQGYALNDDGWIAMSRAAHHLADGPFSQDAIGREWAIFYDRICGKTADEGT